ncbi:DUF6445 family protein [Oleiagrimonas sp. C23AA]|uniref:DUF6445 family protein n=1 Tax=Oleiagrimonas sp. C23AA TaxID=2719047 RepID=UPI001420D986|nr:DUF6445 family protein [Oleiagrimonas sp. C23AA]NII09382.1 hypothetical protein [Oleiagrimonas sp. C23AA]
MLIESHPELRVQKREIGRERAPLLIIDALVAEPERLVHKAGRSAFNVRSAYFPGIRARAPAAYEALLESVLKPLLPEHFGIQPGRFAFSMCHYSLVCTPPQQLQMAQRMPHIDSVEDNGLASVHYLFPGAWGGTAFYRHRGTGFEYIDRSRRETYFRQLEAESLGPQAPAAGYINGDTALFEQVAKVDARFNRLVVYRRHSLHSGCIDSQRVPPADPGNGRLSINTFIDVA